MGEFLNSYHILRGLHISIIILKIGKNKDKANN